MRTHRLLEVFGRVLKTTSAIVPIASVAVLNPSSVAANPKGGNVVAGQAVISAPNSQTLNINQSTNKAIIDWKSFNIAPGETTQFFQPSNTSVTLNRIIGSQSPSKILGSLKANGTIFVINPDGILFGPGSKIDVGGLVATTSDITNKDFMAGRYNFSLPGNPKASIVNLGNISIADRGIGAFVAPGVRNAGIITAKLGKVGLSAANQFTLDMYGDDLIHLKLNDELKGEVIDLATGKPLTNRVGNDGFIKADGGTVALTAATARKVVNSVINNTGVIEANTIGMRRGKIILGAQTAKTKKRHAPKQIVKVSGRISVRGKNRGEKGGLIAVTGEYISAAAIKFEADAWAGGGRVLIGGDYLGGNADAATIAKYGITPEANPVPTATSVNLADDVSITADATNNGDGGKIIVWSDVDTVVHALITARGGQEGGNGGCVETSGGHLEVTKAADASAPNGKAGTWLLDPYNLYVRDTTGSNWGWWNGYLFTSRATGRDHYGYGVYPTGNDSVIDKNLIEWALNGGSNVRVTTKTSTGSQSGNIYIQSDITKTSGGDVRLQFAAAKDIRISSGVDVRSTSGALDLEFWSPDGRISGSNVGRFDLNGGWVHFETRDGIYFTSNYDIPDGGVSIGVNYKGPSTRSTVSAYLRFGKDKIKFSHNNRVITYPTDGIQLVDSTARGGISIRSYGLDAALANNSVLIKNNRRWKIRVGTDRSYGALNALDGKPEFVTDGDATGSILNEPPNGIVPVIEAATFGSKTVNKIYPTAPSGQALIDAYYASFNQLYLNPSMQTALTTPAVLNEPDPLSELATNTTIDLVVDEFIDLFLRESLKIAWNHDVLRVWGDQLDQIALKGLVKSKLTDLAEGPTGWKSLGKSLILGLVKETIVDAYDDQMKKLGLSSLAREPIKYAMNTAGDAFIFATLHPVAAAQAPQLVLLVSASKNTVEVIVEATVVGFDAYKQHKKLRSQIAQFEQASNELVELGYKLRNEGKSEEANALFKLALQAGNAALKLREIYPYETLLEAAWPF